MSPVDKIIVLPPYANVYRFINDVPILVQNGNYNIIDDFSFRNTKSISYFYYLVKNKFIFELNKALGEQTYFTDIIHNAIMTPQLALYFLDNFNVPLVKLIVNNHEFRYVSFQRWKKDNIFIIKNRKLHHLIKYIKLVCHYVNTNILMLNNY